MFCRSARRNSRSSRFRSCACGVSAGIRPFGGSTTSDVRRPVGFADVNTALYAPATSCWLPRSTRRLRPTLPERSVVLVGALLVGEELLVRVPGGPFERGLELVEPDPLEIGMAPRRLRSRPGWPRRSPRPGPGPRQTRMTGGSTTRPTSTTATPSDSRSRRLISYLLCRFACDAAARPPNRKYHALFIPDTRERSRNLVVSLHSRGGTRSTRQAMHKAQ